MEIRQKSVSNKVIICVHGLMYQTCILCKDKTPEQVENEVKQVRINHLNKSAYECQTVFEAKDTDVDLDYDIEVG